jgi:hypothetical protein
MKEYLKQQIQGQKDYIIERFEGKVERKLTEDEIYNLLDIDMDSEMLFSYYDEEDYNSHNFEHGMLRAYENVFIWTY